MLPPGPTAPARVQMLKWITSPLGWLDHCRTKYGPAFTLRMRGYEPQRETVLVVLSSREHARTVLLGDPAVFAAGAAREAMAELQGPTSIFLRDGPAHVIERKLMLPLFHGENLDRYRAEMIDVAQRSIERWPSGQSFPLLPLLQDLTLDLIMRVIFGHPPESAPSPLQEALAELAAYISHPLGIVATDLPHRIGPINLWRRYERVKSKVDVLLEREISARRASRSAPGDVDIAALLVDAKRADGSCLSDRELRDELITLVLAAYDTTSTALAWTFLHIVRDDAVGRRLLDECQRCELDNPYLDSVVKEGLRLHPPVPIVDRKLTRETQLDGFTVPAGVVVTLCPWLIQRDARYYERPLAFWPERFIDTPADTYTWLPFGGGVRRCLGASFAQWQMKAVIATAVVRLQLARARRRRERSRRRLIVLAPARGARIRVLGTRAAGGDPSGELQTGDDRALLTPKEESLRPACP